jgi:hypothetical protein
VNITPTGLLTRNAYHGWGEYCTPLSWNGKTSPEYEVTDASALVSNERPLIGGIVQTDASFADIHS